MVKDVIAKADWNHAEIVAREADIIAWAKAVDRRLGIRLFICSLL